MVKYQFHDNTERIKWKIWFCWKAITTETRQKNIGIKSSTTKKFSVIERRKSSCIVHCMFCVCTNIKSTSIDNNTSKFDLLFNVSFHCFMFGWLVFCFLAWRFFFSSWFFLFVIVTHSYLPTLCTLSRNLCNRTVSMMEWFKLHIDTFATHHIQNEMHKMNFAGFGVFFFLAHFVVYIQ